MEIFINSLNKLPPINIDSPDNSYEIKTYQPKQCFRFLSFDDNWLFEITPEGIEFNHEDHPNFTTNDFAKEFIKILENNYEITFEKRKETK